MTFQFAYQFTQEAFPSNLRDLDMVVLTAAVTDDDGITIPVGSVGTILIVHNGGESYVVEFAEPAGALATVEPNQLRAASDAAA